MIRRILIVHLVIAALVLAGFSSAVSAAVIDTRQALAAEVRQAQITEVQTLMSRADVEQAMVRMGVDPAEAKTRIAALSDAELAQVQTQLESLPAGGDVLVVIGVVFVVLLILELVGVIDVFKGT